jgi:hypothetical protein
MDIGKTYLKRVWRAEHNSKNDHRELLRPSSSLADSSQIDTTTRKSAILWVISAYEYW